MAEANITSSKRDLSAVTSTPTLPADLIEKLLRTDRFAVEQLADFDGPHIFNPLIGRTPDKTFEHLERALSFLYDLMDQDFEPCNSDGKGLTLMVQTMWAASQYEAFRARRADQEGGAA